MTILQNRYNYGISDGDLTITTEFKSHWEEVSHFIYRSPKIGSQLIRRNRT